MFYSTQSNLISFHCPEKKRISLRITNNVEQLKKEFARRIRPPAPTVPTSASQLILTFDMALAMQGIRFVLNTKILSIAVSANRFSCYGFETRVILGFVLPSKTMGAMPKRQETPP